MINERNFDFELNHSIFRGFQTHPPAHIDSPLIYRLFSFIQNLSRIHCATHHQLHVQFCDCPLPEEEKGARKTRQPSTGVLCARVVCE